MSVKAEDIIELIDKADPEEIDKAIEIIDKRKKKKKVKKKKD